MPQQEQALSAYAQDRGAWDAPPQQLQQIQRQGFRDGIEGARKDFDNHRRPDVNDRAEYRDPRVPREQQEAYRDGYRRGYERGASHLTGGPQEPVGQAEQQMLPSEPPVREADRGESDMGPGMGPGVGQVQGSEIQRSGFQDGMEGARKDMDNHRRPNVKNRDEYRHPSVPRGMRDEYREAFSHGYQQGMTQQMGGPDRR
jgi:ribosome modulation factor